MFTTIARTTLTTAVVFAAIAGLASCSPAPAEAPAAVGDAPVVIATPTTEPVVEEVAETPEPTPTPTVDPTSVDGLDAGAVLTPEQCEANLSSAAFDGRAYELLDGSCVLVRYGADQPVPESVRADIEQRGYQASDPVRAPYELKDAERAGIEVAYLTCSGSMGGGWGATGVNTHGSYEYMVSLLNDWITNGSSRTWVTVSTC